MVQESFASQWESIDNSTAKIFWANVCGWKNSKLSHHAASHAAHGSASTTLKNGSTNRGASGSVIIVSSADCFSRKGAKAQRKTQRLLDASLRFFFAPLRLCVRNHPLGSSGAN